MKAQTPLFTAVSGKHLDCVVALLKAGADPNGSQYNNCSPVLTAAREGDVDILRELLRFGAEVDVRPKVPEWASNATACRGPLYISAVYGHLDGFKLLLLHGANPNYNCTDEKMLARIKQPKTVLEVCLRYGCGVEYIQLLIDFGADVYLPTLIIDKTTKQNEALLLLLKERGEADSVYFTSVTCSGIRSTNGNFIGLLLNPGIEFKICLAHKILNNQPLSYLKDRVLPYYQNRASISDCRLTCDSRSF